MVLTWVDLGGTRACVSLGCVPPKSPMSYILQLPAPDYRLFVVSSQPLISILLSTS